MDFAPEQHEDESSDAQEILDHFNEARRSFIESLPLPPPAEIANAGVCSVGPVQTEGRP